MAFTVFELRLKLSDLVLSTQTLLWLGLRLGACVVLTVITVRVMSRLILSIVHSTYKTTKQISNVMCSVVCSLGIICYCYCYISPGNYTTVCILYTLIQAVLMMISKNYSNFKFSSMQQSVELIQHFSVIYFACIWYNL